MFTNMSLASDVSTLSESKIRLCIKLIIEGRKEPNHFMIPVQPQITVQELCENIETYVERKDPSLNLQVQNVFVEEQYAVDPSLQVFESF